MTKEQEKLVRKLEESEDPSKLFLALYLRSLDKQIKDIDKMLRTS